MATSGRTGEAVVTALPLGLFTVPGREIAKYPGVVVRAPYVVCAYLVRTPDVCLLFDTGIVGDEGAVAHYRPRHLPLAEQLSAHGVDMADVDVIVNCHLHADHAGGNHLFPRTEIVVQRRELAAAGSADYTVDAACWDFPGALLTEVDGPHQVSRHIGIVPSPGHSPGHQCLVVTGTSEGTVVLAGQAFDSASEYASAVLARQLSVESLEHCAPDWVDDLLATEAAVVRFAHDLAEWRPGPSFAGSSPRSAWPDP